MARLFRPTEHRVPQFGGTLEVGIRYARRFSGLPFPRETLRFGDLAIHLRSEFVKLLLLIDHGGILGMLQETEDSYGHQEHNDKRIPHQGA